MKAIASQITGVSIVYSTVYSGTYQRKYQSFASLTVVNGNSTVTVNSPHKGPVTRTMLPFDYVIMTIFNRAWDCYHDNTGNISFQDIFSLMMLLMKLYVPCAQKNLIKSMLVSNIKTEAVIPICDLIRENQSQIGLLNGMSWPQN